MARVNSFLRGSRKHDTDLRRKTRKKKWLVMFLIYHLEFQYKEVM
jgi:hypothetical protein